MKGDVFPRVSGELKRRDGPLRERVKREPVEYSKEVENRGCDWEVLRGDQEGSCVNPRERVRTRFNISQTSYFLFLGLNVYFLIRTFTCK